MAKIINISDKLTNERPKIQLGDNLYEVNDSVTTVFKFEELANSDSSKSLIEALTAALGKDSIKEMGVEKMSLANVKVLMTAVFACMSGVGYEEAAARFQTDK